MARGTSPAETPGGTIPGFCPAPSPHRFSSETENPAGGRKSPFRAPPGFSPPRLGLRTSWLGHGFGNAALCGPGIRESQRGRDILPAPSTQTSPHQPAGLGFSPEGAWARIPPAEEGAGGGVLGPKKGCVTWDTPWPSLSFCLLLLKVTWTLQDGHEVELGQRW